MRRLRLRHLGIAVALVLCPSFADAKPPAKRAKLEPPAQRLTPSGKSVGSPNAGKLVGGARLGDAPYIRIVPVYAQNEARWGVESLVSAIERAARAVRRQFPDAVLSVGHLSKKGGGAIDRHASHESGRDADIAFYVKNVKGKPIYADHFVPFKGDGTAPSWPGAQFDDAKNWAFVAAMLGDPRVRITHVFVSIPIRQRLLAYAAKAGAPSSLRVRASQVMVQPRGALPHDDHFHVRIGCPSGMDKCVELPTARKRRGAPPSANKQATAKAEAPPKREPKPAPHPPNAMPAKPAPPPVTSDETSDDMPSLGPIVPGLDSAVIPKPIEGLAPPRKELPPLPPIEDPDGIYDER